MSRDQQVLPRRQLPKVDISAVSEDPLWLRWKSVPPAVPGWYWVRAAGAWPQCVEFAYSGGVIQSVDRHSSGTLGNRKPFWRQCAGPIPDPEATPIKPKKRR